MAIFISHITEEAPVALTLKEWIEGTFLGQVKVFVSSDSDDIPPGDQWLDDIDTGLGESQVMIILCSPTSINRPWINFEAGCAWIKRIPIIPICYSGQDKGKLPVPLSRFQGLNIDEDVQILFKAINKHLKLNINKFPRIDNKTFKKELYEALAKTAPIQANLAVEKQVAGVDQLEEIEIKIIKSIASGGEINWSMGRKGSSAEGIASIFTISEITARYYLDKLVEKGYISHIHQSDPHSPARFTLNSKGRAFVVENKLI